MRIRLESISFTSILSFIGASIRSLILLTVPLLLTDLNTPITHMGLLLVGFSLVIALLSTGFGMAADFLGRRKIVSLGLLFVLGSSLLLVRSRDLLVITAAFLMLAAGWAAFEPSLSALVGDKANPSKVGRAYGTFTAVLQAGLALGPAVTGFLISFFGFGAPFLASSLLALSGLLTLMFAYGAEQADLHGSRGEGGIMETLRSLSRDRLILAGWVSMVPAFIIEGGYTAFFPVYLRNIGVEPWTIGLLFTFQFIVGILTRFPIGIFLDRINDKSVALIFSLLVNAGTVALLPMSANPFVLSALIGTMSAARSVTYIGGTVSVAVGSSAKHRGLAMGLTSSLRAASSSLGPLLFTLGASTIGFGFGFSALAAISLPGSVLLVVLSRRSNRGTKQEKEL